MILRYRFNLAVSRSLPYENRFHSIFQRPVYYGKVHLRQMPNPAAYGRSDTHKTEQYLSCKQNTHLAASQLEKGCKRSASLTLSMHSVANVQTAVPVSHSLHYSL